MIVLFFMHWIVSSSGIGMVGMTDADTAQWARLFRPGLADELGSVLGLGSFISGKEILYHTLFSYPIFCSEYHRTVSLSHVISLSVPSAPCWKKETFSLSRLAIPSPHPQAAPTESCISKISKRHLNSFSSWDKTWSPNNKYWFKAWICKVSNYQSHL